MAVNGIQSVELVLTSGTYYTVWASSWKVHGEDWQGFLGDDDSVFVFDSPAALLAYCRHDSVSDLSNHPEWGALLEGNPRLWNPRQQDSINFIDLPLYLAEKPGVVNVKKVARAFHVLKSLGEVLGIEEIIRFFGSYSVLANVARGVEHYRGETGSSEWSAVGYAVSSNWVTLLDAIEKYLSIPEVDILQVGRAREDIDTAEMEYEEKKAALENSLNEEKEENTSTEEKNNDEEDPYDSSIWAAAGIDPIKITLDGRSVYTLRCYVDSKPVFLGEHGLINTFNSSRSLVRWMIGSEDHDLVDLSTWQDLVTAANAGELEITVHSSNEYVFTGLRSDITAGMDKVDTDQLARAYELLADVADWAQDDSVNKILIAYPRLQSYIAFMLGSPTKGTPSAPFDEEAKGWKALEEELIKHFTKFSR